MHVSPMYTKFDLGNRPTAVGGKVREVYSGFFTFQLSKSRIYRSIQYNTCMSHQISESFLLFSFSRVHDCIHYPCKGAAVSQCQPNLASCHNVKF